MRSNAAAAHSEKKARRRSSVMGIAPAGGGAGSSGEASGGCFGARFARRVLRLVGLASGAPVAAGCAGGAASATGGGASNGAAAAEGSLCALKEKLECLLPRETQTIVPLSPSSEWFDKEASPEDREKQRFRRAARAESDADLGGAEGEGLGGFSSEAGGEESLAEVANRPPRRDATGRRGSCCGGTVAELLDALLAEDGVEASVAGEMRRVSAVDEAAAEDTNCSGGMRGEAAGRGIRFVPKMTVRVVEDPGIAGSAALALATFPGGRDECCAAKPGSRDLGTFEDMTWVVGFAKRKYTR